MIPFLKFRDDNVMTLRRTPWAGTRIARSYRLPGSTGASLGQIGESWDFSFDAEHPSRNADDGRSFPDIAAAAPKPILMGRHLIALGYKPSGKFGEWLAAVFEAQLDGAFTDLDGAIAYFKSHFQAP